MDFLNQNDLNLDFLSQNNHKNNKCSLDNKVLNTARLSRAGFKVVQLDNDKFKIKPIKKTLIAKLNGIAGSNFIKRIIMDCVDKECELQNSADDHLWEIKQLIDGSFLIIRKGIINE